MLVAARKIQYATGRYIIPIVLDTLWVSGKSTAEEISAMLGVVAANPRFASRALPVSESL
ncbi:MAG: hypothetical protein DMG61_07995 [Acidobacteria bacterium]|nr:MAG: hypothetical protein DMG61_07995 [Acidobacteriota bacterium]